MFLGIEVDTINQQLHLTEEKLDHLLAELEVTRGRKIVFKRELQSLTGLLQHASTVVQPVRILLQMFYALQGVGSPPPPQHQIEHSSNGKHHKVARICCSLEWGILTTGP